MNCLEVDGKNLWPSASQWQISCKQVQYDSIVETELDTAPYPLATEALLLLTAVISSPTEIRKANNHYVALLASENQVHGHHPNTANQ